MHSTTSHSPVASSITRSRRGRIGDVATEQVKHELADVVEDDAALFDGGRNRLEPVVAQHDCGGLLRHVGASSTHGDAHIRLSQRRCVVDAVADHGDDLAAHLQRRDDPQLVLGRDTAEHTRVRHRRMKVAVGESLQQPARFMRDRPRAKGREPRTVLSHQG